MNLKRCYDQQRNNSKSRNKEFNLTYEEWLNIWAMSGKLEKRGRGSAKYCMCRFGDKGAYEVGNVFIGSGGSNSHDGNIGKVLSTEIKAKMSASKLGVRRPDIEISRGKPVDMRSKNGVFIRSYISVASAFRVTGIAASSINNVCNGKRNSAGNHLWNFTQ